MTSGVCTLYRLGIRVVNMATLAFQVKIATADGKWSTKVESRISTIWSWLKTSIHNRAHYHCYRFLLFYCDSSEIPYQRATGQSANPWKLPYIRTIKVSHVIFVQNWWRKFWRNLKCFLSNDCKSSMYLLQMHYCYCTRIMNNKLLKFLLHF